MNLVGLHVYLGLLATKKTHDLQTQHWASTPAGDAPGVLGVLTITTIHRNTVRMPNSGGDVRAFGIYQTKDTRKRVENQPGGNLGQI